MHHRAARVGELTSARAILREEAGKAKKERKKINLLLATAAFCAVTLFHHKQTCRRLFFSSPLQNIALYEWLPAYLGDEKLPPYPGNNSPAGARVHAV